MILDRMGSGRMSGSGDRPGWGWRGRARTIVAGVVVGLIVLAAVVVVVASRGGGGKTRPAAPAASSLGAAAPGGPVPPPAALDQAVPTSPPSGVVWSLFEGVALPASLTAGPLRVVGPVHAGYARTPVGALLAAAQIGYRYLISPGDDWRPVVQQQVMPGVGRDVYVRKHAAVGPVAAEPAGTLGQLAGFRFVTYDPDTAVIQLVTRASDGSLQVGVYTVSWISGDWRLQLQPDGSAIPTVQAVSDLSGFVPWGGV